MFLLFYSGHIMYPFAAQLLLEMNTSCLVEN